MKVLEISQRPETLENIEKISDYFETALLGVQERYPEFFTGVRKNGLVMGLEFDHPRGAELIMRELYKQGVWAIYSALDPRVLQFKAGLLMSQQLSEEVIELLDVSIANVIKKLSKPS